MTDTRTPLRTPRLRMPGTGSVLLSPRRSFDCEEVEAVAGDPGPVIALSEEAIAAVVRGHAWLSDDRQDASADKPRSLSGLGWLTLMQVPPGEPTPASWVRAAMFLRAHSLSRGYTGVRLEALTGYLEVLSAGLTPEVPHRAVVGASAAPNPLGCIARVLMGEGVVVDRGRRRPAALAMLGAGIRLRFLNRGDLRALTSGTAFLTGIAAQAVARGRRLLAVAEGLTGWSYRLLGCSWRSLDPARHERCGHLRQAETAARILREASRAGEGPDPNPSLREPAPLRWAAQVLGACRDNLSSAAQVIEAELNGVRDQPLPDGDGYEGDSYSQQVAFAADGVNAALTQAGILIAQQVDSVLDPRVNPQAEVLIRGGELAGARLSAAALVAEARSQCQSHALAQPDLLAVGTLAARRAFAQTELLARLLAVLGNVLDHVACVDGQVRSAPPPWFPRSPDLDQVAARWLAPPPAQVRSAAPAAPERGPTSRSLERQPMVPAVSSALTLPMP